MRTMTTPVQTEATPSVHDLDAAAQVRRLAVAARRAARTLALLSRAEKDAALRGIADALDAASDDIVAANDEDVARGRDGGMAESLLDRLRY